MSASVSLVGVFSEVPFWNSVEYRILYGIDFILRNCVKFFALQYYGMEFRIGSCQGNSVYIPMKNLNI
jgi:hypothetical protein